MPLLTSLTLSSPCCFVTMSYEGSQPDGCQEWHCPHCDIDYVELPDGELIRREYEDYEEDDGGDEE